MRIFFIPLEKLGFVKYLILAGFFFSAVNYAYPSDTAVVTKDKINARVDATVMSPSLGYLNNREIVTVVEDRFEWCKVILPKRFSSYAAAEFLEKIDDNKVKVIASDLNLRNKPSMSSYVIGHAPKDAVFFFRKEKAGWYELRGYPYAYGWVNKNFLFRTDKSVNLEGVLLPFNDENCEANYILRAQGKKYFLNILTKGKTKFINKRAKIEGIKTKGSCPYIIVTKITFIR